MQPVPNATSLTAEQLRPRYAYPDSSAPWVRVNFVTSIDGGVTLDGVSGGLGTPTDTTVFRLLRELADVIVVGAGTVRAENYGGAKLTAEQQARRVALGQAPVPPIAVVSRSGALDPSSRLFTDTDVAPILLTGALTPADVVGALAERGLRRVLCEGGPGLVGQFLTADAVDEVCLTTAPQLIGGTGSRMAVSPTATPRPMHRALLLGADDGTVLTRWVRTR